MKHKPLFALLATLALLLLAQLPVPAGSTAPAAISFTLTRLTENTAEDTRPTLAVDDTGKAHVAYERGGDIYYATNSSGSWVTTPVSTDPADEYHPAIALDGSGQAHVAYFSGSPPSLDIYYATQSGSAWTTENAGGTNMPATWNLHLDLALGGAGRAYIAYHTYDSSDYEIEVRHRESQGGAAPTGGWSTLALTNNAVQDEYPSIAVETSGAIHIAFQRYDANDLTYDLWYATYTGGAWNFSQVTDSAGLDDKAPSLALDGAGKAHLAWEVGNGLEPAEIGYATDASGAWITTTLTANTEHDTNPSLAVDGSGQAHIAYEHFETKYHIHYVSNAGGAWATDVVASAPLQEAFLAANDHALAVDESGYVHVVYFADDGNDDEVWYAHSDQPGGPPANHPPNVPSDPVPPDQASGVGLEDNVLSWSGGDPDAGDMVTYDVYFGSSSPPPLAQSDWPTTSLTVVLTANTHYYWQVVASDGHGLGTGGPVWEFTTSGGSYSVYLPFVTRHHAANR